MDETIDNAPALKLVATAGNSVTLSDGRVAVVRDALGKDQIDAKIIMDGNSDMFYFALFELCVLVDGEKLFKTDYLSMKLKDTTAITLLFDKINF